MQVYLASLNETHVACKVLTPAGDATRSGSSWRGAPSSVQAALHKECSLMASLRHPHVVSSRFDATVRLRPTPSPEENK